MREARRTSQEEEDEREDVEMTAFLVQSVAGSRKRKDWPRK